MTAVTNKTNNRRNNRKHRPVIDSGKWHAIIESILGQPPRAAFKLWRVENDFVYCSSLSSIDFIISRDILCVVKSVR